MTRNWLLAGYVGITLLNPALIVALPAPTPPGIPTASAAQSELSALTVAAQGSEDGYSRAKFPHWITQSGYDLSRLLASGFI